MTNLRDEIALEAFKLMLSAVLDRKMNPPSDKKATLAQALAKDAWIFADAMIEVRNRSVKTKVEGT